MSKHSGNLRLYVAAPRQPRLPRDHFAKTPKPSAVGHWVFEVLGVVLALLYAYFNHRGH